MKKNILVIYYSQTGQLKEILERIFKEKNEEIEIDYVEVKPSNPFPFPWSAKEFYDAMPESVQQIPESIHILQIPEKDYDLIVLGYQPWFLSLSIPMNSFLQSEQASVLKGKNVLTVIGSRNMWLNSQEQVKQQLLNLHANLVGNIVFFDDNPNLISVLTIVRWTFTGQKERSQFLPEAGVQKKDIEAASRFGELIYHSVIHSEYESLQGKLLEKEAVVLKPGLIILEKRGIKNFRKFSLYILEKGKRKSEARQKRVKLFGKLLFIGVFILSPISNFTAKVLTILHRKKLLEDVKYFKNIVYRKNAI